MQDLLTLRSLGKKPTGIALERLNAGERKKAKANKGGDKSGKQTEEEKWQDQMRNGGLVAKTAPAGGAEEDR